MTLKGTRKILLEPNFLDNTEPIPFSGCFIWMRSLNDSGYGKLYVRGKMIRAHRRAWELFRGPIPKGKWVLHRCDTPSCVNPDHLFIGTAGDNNLDCMRKKRRLSPSTLKTHCPKGHPYDEANTYRWGKKKRRICKQCSRISTIKYRAKKRELRKLTSLL